MNDVPTEYRGMKPLLQSKAEFPHSLISEWTQMLRATASLLRYRLPFRLIHFQIGV